MFDPKCYELAEYFLQDGAPESDKCDLAQTIQDAVEYWGVDEHEAETARVRGRAARRTAAESICKQVVEHAVTNDAGQTIAVILSIGSSQDIVDAIDADQTVPQ